jgi:hypothetical protein
MPCLILSEVLIFNFPFIFIGEGMKCFLITVPVTIVIITIKIENITLPGVQEPYGFIAALEAVAADRV